MNLLGSAGSGGAGLSPALTNASAMVRDETAAATDAGGSRAPRAGRSATCRATCGNGARGARPAKRPAVPGESPPASAHFREGGPVPAPRGGTGAQARRQLAPPPRAPGSRVPGKPLAGCVPPAPPSGPQQTVRHGSNASSFPSATTLFKALTLQNVN